jgi:eukaryotic-like serine/threonine-protein kinase
MTREEWERIKTVSAAVLEQPESERQTCLAQLCAGDEALEREVRSLLGSMAKASHLFENPVFAKPAALRAGMRLGPYDVVAPIGAGGMGEVYRARDDRLGRDVAIKVLPAFFASDRDRVRRFEQEARAAGQLSHPNIVTVFDVGWHDGSPYVVCELLEGETLRERLANPISIAGALGYTLQLAEGLASAHEKGIIHRDLKPENLFVTRDDRVKIFDFGLAKLIQNDSQAFGDSTGPGAVLGTAGYMSPEQVRGAATDQRSDLFAVGSILYEMVSGVPAFQGDSPVETMHAILANTPPALVKDGMPVAEAIQALVDKALQKDANGRFQSARELATELRTLIAGVSDGTLKSGPRRSEPVSVRSVVAFLVIALAAAAGVAGWKAFRGPHVIQRDTVVLGEIANSTGDPAFDGVMRQALLIQLDQSPFLQIVPDSDVRETLQMMGRKADERLTAENAREVCQRDGAKATIIGSLAGLGGGYVVDLTASDCLTGDAFAREQEQIANKEEVLQGLARTTSRLRGKLGESLSSVRQFDVPIERATTASLEALKFLSQAAAARSRGSDAQSITFLNRAIELDPEFPLAHIRLSAIYSTAGEMELAGRHAQHAYDRRQLTGGRERLAIEHGYYKRVEGDFDKATERLEVARQTYPYDYNPSLNLSTIYTQSGKYEPALKEALESIRLKAPNALATSGLARAYMGLNQFDEARRVIGDPNIATLGVAQRNYLYMLDFISQDTAGMQHQLDVTKGTLGEPYVRAWHAHAAAAGGRYREAREQFRLTAESAQRFGLREVSATTVALGAITEAAAGNRTEATERANASIALFFGRQSSGLAGVALAMTGGSDRIAELDARLAKTFPADTLLNAVYLPCNRALVARNAGRPAEGIEILRRAEPYELGWTSYYLPPYIRGLLYLDLGDGAKAQEQFKRIIDHIGIMPVSPLYSLSHLQLARAAALSGDRAAARKAYEEFLASWKDADPGSTLLGQARTEYSQLTRDGR